MGEAEFSWQRHRRFCVSQDNISNVQWTPKQIEGETNFNEHNDGSWIDAIVIKVYENKALMLNHLYKFLMSF